MRLSTFARLIGAAVRESLRAKREARMLDAGDRAPDFEVKDHNGRTLRLSQARGRTVVLWFYPKADTPG